MSMCTEQDGITCMQQTTAFQAGPNEKQAQYVSDQ